MVKRRNFTPRQERDLLNSADKIIINYILKNKLNINYDDVRYIEGSTLDQDDKKSAIESIQGKNKKERNIIFKELGIIK